MKRAREAPLLPEDLLTERASLTAFLRGSSCLAVFLLYLGTQV